MKNQTKTTEIGALASEDYFHKHTSSFAKLLPDFKPSVNIKSTFIRKVFEANNSIKGIRFMFGLEDKLNPNSVRILLVPAGSSSDFGEPRFTFLSDKGYLDHLGVFRSMHSTCELISSFVRNVKNQIPELEYKKITRGGFLGKESLLKFIEENDCEEITLHFGYKESQDEIIPIIEPLNELVGPYMNFSKPCPTTCPGGPEPGEPCIATDSVRYNSNEKELDNHRSFRDNHLLKLNNGEVFYEMYYFISPMVSYLISKEENSDLILRRIYEEKIKPFNTLLDIGEFDGALDILKDTLAEWVETYQMKDFKHSYII